MSPRTYTEKKE